MKGGGRAERGFGEPYWHCDVAIEASCCVLWLTNWSVTQLDENWRIGGRHVHPIFSHRKILRVLVQHLPTTAIIHQIFNA